MWENILVLGRYMLKYLGLKGYDLYNYLKWFSKRFSKKERKRENMCVERETDTETEIYRNKANLAKC